MAVEATFTDGCVLKNILKPISEMAKFITFEFSAQGLTMNQYESGQIARIHLNLEADFFKEYKCQTDIRVGIYTSDLVKCLKFANDSTVTFSAEDNIDVVTIKVLPKEGFPLIYYKKKCEPKVEADEEVFDFMNEIEMPSKEFYQVITDISLLGSDINVQCDKGHPNELRFAAKAVGEGRCLVPVMNKDDTDCKFKIKSDFDYDYLPGYLLWFAEGHKLTPTVTLKFHFPPTEGYNDDSGYLQVAYNFKSKSDKNQSIGYLRFAMTAKLSDKNPFEDQEQEGIESRDQFYSSDESEAESDTDDLI